MTNLESIKISDTTARYPTESYPHTDQILKLLLTHSRGLYRRIALYCNSIDYSNVYLFNKLVVANPNLLGIDVANRTYNFKKNEYGPWSIETQHKFPYSFRKRVKAILRHVINIINDDVLYIIIAALWEQIRIDPNYVFQY